MKSSAKNIKLASVDELFSTEESRADETREKIIEIPLTELHPFQDHPFKVIDNEAMFDTAESVKQYGVLVPAIARPRDEGGYELVAGHRRKRACELAELETMPVIVRNLDDDAAIIIMVDSNLQRENILPSERAFAFKLKLEAIKRQGKRADLTSSQLGTKLPRADEIIAEQAGSSRNQVQRFIRLTNLIPEILSMVDEKKIAFNHKIISCPNKEKPQMSYYSKSSHTAKFKTEQCERCPLFTQCPVKKEKKGYSVKFSHKSYETCKLREKMTTKEYIQLTNKRAGVEGIPSVIRRKYHADDMPVRGLLRSKMWFGFKVGAYNFNKMLRYLKKKGNLGLILLIMNILHTIYGNYRVNLNNSRKFSLIKISKAAVFGV